MGSSIAGSRAATLALANMLDMMGIGGSNSSTGAKLPKNYNSLSAENCTAPLPAVPKLILWGIWTYLGCHHSRQRIKEHFFSEADM
jgi:hypothetical protein